MATTTATSSSNPLPAAGAAAGGGGASNSDNSAAAAAAATATTTVQPAEVASFYVRVPASCFPLQGRVLQISPIHGEGSSGVSTKVPHVHVLAPHNLRPGQSVMSPRPATIESTDILSVSPLWAAAESGDAEMFDQALSGKGAAAVEVDNSAGGSPVIVTSSAAVALLHLASKKGHKDVVVALLRRFPRLVNVVADGSSALHIAAREGHVRVIRALLSYKADINVVDAHGKTPVALAKTRGISRLLAANDLEHAAKSHEMPKRLVDYCVILRETTTATSVPESSRQDCKSERQILCRWPEEGADHPDLPLGDIHPLQLLTFLTCNTEDEDCEEEEDDWSTTDEEEDDDGGTANADAVGGGGPGELQHKRLSRIATSSPRRRGGVKRIDLNGGSAQTVDNRRRQRTRRRRSARTSALTNDARRIFWCGLRLDDPDRQMAAMPGGGAASTSSEEAKEESNETLSPQISTADYVLIISHWPYLTLLKLVAESLRGEWNKLLVDNVNTIAAGTTTHDSMTVALHEVVTATKKRLQAFCACALPSPSSQVQITWPGLFQYRIHRPQGLPVLDPYCFECLFSCLSITNVASLLGVLLAEDNILFCTRRVHLLAPALEALQSLIFPFRWTQVYVPVLPAAMIDMTDSPVPWLMGTHVLNVGLINTNHNPGELPTQITMVNLDENCIVPPSMADRAYTQRTSLPRDVKKKFCRQLLAAVSLGKFSDEQRSAVDRDRRLLRGASVGDFSIAAGRASASKGDANQRSHETGRTHGAGGSGSAAVVGVPDAQLRAAERLREYYLFWNPQKLEDPTFLYQVLTVKYKGREDQLYKDLATIYGAEPIRFPSPEQSSEKIKGGDAKEDAEGNNKAVSATTTPFKNDLVRGSNGCIGWSVVRAW
eukprot:INCI16386.4.p1 GENE.INCI16386.4~~INCI16386.4.p1  ORF type:complete len:889 (-),score=155.10 INCI16386.4:2065-4731(-)